ncbi:MAG: phosphatidate cytidylyltransferase [Burkholderiaceae bacterium]
MLRHRVVTALVLLAVLLPALFATTPWPFTVVTLLLIGAAGWEWARLNGLAAFALVSGALLGIACALALWVDLPGRVSPWVWWIATVGWVLGGGATLVAGPPYWPKLPSGVRWVLGMALLFVAWLALARARGFGVNFILSVLCLVWVADIAAYFGGRRFGRRKLAPSISPGKTWEGAASGMLGALLLAFGWVYLDRHIAVDSASLYSRLLEQLGGLGMMPVVAFLAAMSVVGDLFESLVKRSAGAKDSSALLPGHGGVLDRIDALLPVFPIALAMAAL